MLANVQCGTVGPNECKSSALTLGLKFIQVVDTNDMNILHTFLLCSQQRKMLSAYELWSVCL